MPTEERTAELQRQLEEVMQAMSLDSTTYADTQLYNRLIKELNGDDEGVPYLT